MRNLLKWFEALVLITFISIKADAPLRRICSLHNYKKTGYFDGYSSVVFVLCDFNPRLKAHRLSILPQFLFLFK